MTKAKTKTTQKATTQSQSQANSSKIISLPQQGQAQQPTKPKSKPKKSKGKGYNLGSQLRSISLKIYIEHTMTDEERNYYMSLLGLDFRTGQPAQKVLYVTDQAKATKSKAPDKAYAKKLEKQCLERFEKKLSSIDQSWEFYDIYHDLDPVRSSGDPFEVAVKKGHFHIAGWRADGNRFRVKKVLDLLGIHYRPYDANLWDNRGIELIKDKSTLLTYFLHKTKDAEEKGKVEYPQDKIATNRTQSELTRWLHGYTHRIEKKERLSLQDWDHLRDDAYQVGVKLRDFQVWADDHFYARQQAQTTFSVVHSAYERGLVKGMENLPLVPRLSILIYGDANQGKTYTARETLKAMGLRITEATKGTGKYDNVTPLTDALFFDDIGVTQARQVFDNRPVILHRRNHGDRPWLGRYAVVTSNRDPESEIKSMCGIKRYGSFDGDMTEDDQRIYDAVSSRLCIAHIEDGKLVFDKLQERGDKTFQDKIEKMAQDFKAVYDSILSGYHPVKKFGTDGQKTSKNYSDKRVTEFDFQNSSDSASDNQNYFKDLLENHKFNLDGEAYVVLHDNKELFPVVTTLGDICSWESPAISKLCGGFGEIYLGFSTLPSILKDLVYEQMQFKISMLETGEN